MSSVRARATIGATAVAGLALVTAAVALLVVLRWSYVESARGPAQSRADAVAATLERGTSPGQLALEEGEDRFTQIVEGDQVVAASANAIGVGSLAEVGGDDVSAPVGDADDVWVIVTASAGPGRTVVVGREIDPPLESIATPAGAVAVGVPLLVGLIALITWRVVGAALAPVEAIRAQVASIGPGELDERVPVPSSGDEIAELATTMNQMLDRISTAQRRQRQFASDASHELRSPLAAIRQHAEVARAHPELTTSRALADEVLGEEARMEQLVDDLLLLTRSDEGGLGLRPATIDLDHLALDEARRACPPGIELDTSSIAAVRVVGDESLLRRAVGNLVDNAARHAGGRIRVATHEDQATAVVAVDDDGPGIPADRREEVFERFVRLDDSRSADTGGTGLGLAIVAEVASAHGGTATIGDSPLGGTSVTIRLPRSPS